MSVVFAQCANCYTQLKLGANFSGRTIKCPKCAKDIAIPGHEGGEEEDVEERPTTTRRESTVGAATPKAAAVAVRKKAVRRTDDPDAEFASDRAIRYVFIVAALLAVGFGSWQIYSFFKNSGPIGRKMDQDDTAAVENKETSGGATFSRSSDSEAANPQTAPLPSANSSQGAAGPPTPNAPSSATGPTQGVNTSPAPQLSSGPSATPAPSNTPVDVAVWPAIPANLFEVNALFPGAPETNAADRVSNDLAGEFAKAMATNREALNYRAKFNDRVYSLTISSMDRGGLSPTEFVERTVEMIRSLQPGFELKEVYAGETNSKKPVRDFVLASPKGVRVVRLLPTDTETITQVVEGPSGMPYESSDVKAFLGNLKVRGESVGGMTSIPLSNFAVRTPGDAKANPIGKDSVWPIHRFAPQPYRDEWNYVGGNSVLFRVKLPTPEFQRVHASRLVADAEINNRLRQNWDYNTTGKGDTIYLDQGTRRLLVFAVEVKSEGAQPFEVSQRAGSAIAMLEEIFETRNVAWRIVEQSNDKLGPSVAKKSEGAMHCIIRRKIVGQYAFFMVMESSEPLEWGSAPANQFFESLQAPLDARG